MDPERLPMTVEASEYPPAESILPEDVGLPADARMPFRFAPGEQWSPLVISFPHVGLLWPHDLRPKPQVDFAANADYEVHQLYRGCHAWGVATIAAIYSRLVVDLNRAADDISPMLVPDHPAPRPRAQPGETIGASLGGDQPRDRPGRGVVWDRAVGNLSILRRPLQYAEFQRRIDRYHAPYHRAVELLLARRRARFGYAVLLDAHSMPGSVGVDFVLGTLDGRTCSPGLVDQAAAILQTPLAPAEKRANPLTLRRDRPYRGGELIRRFGQPARGYHALQLEISRGRYMDERTHRLLLPEEAAGPADRRGRGALAELCGRVRYLVQTLAQPGLDLVSSRQNAGERGS